MNPRARLVLRGTVSVALLVAVATVLDPAAVGARLAGLRLGWVAAALAVTVVQVVLSAWRWRYTAGRLGLHLPLHRAVAEYYLATFLNQVLPGGVGGDVARAWRHASAHEGSGGEAVSAVVLERVSGQVIMTGVAVLSGLVLVSAGLTRLPTPGAAGGLVLTVAVAAGVLAAPPMARRLGRLPVLGQALAHARTALLGRALPVQLLTSLLVVGSYLAVFVLGARSLGVETPTTALLPLVAPVLVTMLVPVTVAGWGLREGAAAALWATAGLSPADGVAISVAYGLLVLVSSLPGAGLLALIPLGRRRSGDPGRRPGPAPAGRGAPGAGAPRRGGRSAEG